MGLCLTPDFMDIKLPESLKYIFDSMNEKKFYKLFFKIYWIEYTKDKGRKNIRMCDKPLIVTKKTGISNIVFSLKESLHLLIESYGINDQNIYLIGCWREWVNAPLNKESPLILPPNAPLSREETRLKYVHKSLKERVLNMENFSFKKILMNEYGNFVENLELEDNKIYSIYKNEVEPHFAVLNKDNSNIVYSWTGEKPILSEFLLLFIDHGCKDGFNREMGNTIHYYKNNKHVYSEKKYSCKGIKVVNKSKNYNKKIGTIDLECYVQNDEFVVYAGGYAVNNYTFTTYIQNSSQNGEYILKEIFNSIFNNGFKDYYFYAHNLGGFDGLLIIKGLANNPQYKLKAFWRGDDNKLLSLKITNIETGHFIKIHDSLELLHNNLDTILKTINCNTQKLSFPHQFVNIDRLFYVGATPDIKFFKKINKEEYTNLFSNNWDLKKELINYLKNDLEGLLEALQKISSYVYDTFSLNITKYLTLPSLSLALFTSNFFPENGDEHFKVLPKIVSNDIREAYYGGISFNKTNHILNAEYYDVVSQYPYVMKNEMPTGSPRFTTDKNIKNYKKVGFIFANIIPTSDNKIISFRNNGEIVYPVKPFNRWIYVAEAESALKYGFKVNIICGYKFEPHKVFDSFVDYFFDIKKNTEDPVQRTIAKLILNSLYGKFGSKTPTFSIKLTKTTNLKALDSIRNIEFITEVGPYSVIYDYGELPDIIYKSELEEKTYMPTDDYKLSHLTSLVHLSAAISALGRIYMHPLIMDKKNPALVVNTDSVVVQKPLKKNVGSELGDLKHQYKIKEAIYIYPKLYYHRTEDNQEIIKSAGIDKTQLSYTSFKNMLDGQTISIDTNKFEIELRRVSILFTPYTINISKPKEAG